MIIVVIFKVRTVKSMKYGIRSIAEISIFTALLAILSQFVIPMTVPITLQSLGVMLACMILGGKRAMAAICAYIALGAVGVPVFSFFGGGIGVLTGPLGGYIFGFLAVTFTVWLFEHLSLERGASRAIGCVVGLLPCYFLGALQYGFTSSSPLSLSEILKICILPFVIPDILKAFIAFFIFNRIKNYRIF